MPASDRSLHVGFYAPALPSTELSNGIVTYVRFMQAALRTLGHRVTVVAPNGVEWADGRVEAATPEQSAAARLHRFLKRIPARGSARVRPDVGIARLIRAAHRRDPFDVFEMEESFGWAGHLDLDVPVVIRLHGPHFLGKDQHESAEEAAASNRRIADEGHAIAQVEGITCPSARLLATVLDHYGVAPRRAAAIYNPIAAAPPDECWSIERCDRNQLLFVGRFDLRKGADIALRAFTLAARRNPNLRMVMCGPDPGVMTQGRRRHFPAFLAATIAPELHARIEFRGALPSAEIARLRRVSALCLSTSRFEVLAYGMTEALAVGMPLIASDTFGMSELLKPGENGFVVPVGDAVAVAATIEAALENPSRLAAIGTAGRDLCTAELDPRHLAEKMVEFYRKLL